MVIKRILTGVLLVFSGAALAQIDLQFTNVPGAPPGVVEIANAGDGRNRLFLVVQSGTIRIHDNGVTLAEPFLDIRDRVNSSESEQGLLTIAFPPGDGDKTHFYAYYTIDNGDTVLSRFAISSDPNRALPDSEQVLLTIDQFAPNHNGGRMRFGPDGYLYLSTGDGGAANDPPNNAQRLNTLLGKILRLDVESGEEPYGIPPDNPFVGDSFALEEIWAYGLRNPWRISFDSQTGDLYIADVGQGAREEVNVQPASSDGGENYGWRVAEGDICNGDCSGFTEPVLAYSHAGFNCSITGGEVYRGSDYPDMFGRYFYGDFCSGRFWTLRRSGGQWINDLVLDSEASIVTFGLDEVGNIYLSNGGTVVLLSDGQPAEASFPISGRMSGQWVADGMNSQGLNLLVGERDNGSNFAFFVWFTYLDGEPYWIVGNENYTPGDSSITFDTLRLEGLDFLQRDGASADTPVDIGELTIKALGCEDLRVSWDFPSFSSADTLTMRPLVSVDGAEC